MSLRDTNVDAIRPDALLHGSGEMARLVREKDWAATPLGPLDRWPAELISTLNLMLGSAFPMAVYWGPERRMLYNDAYQPFLSRKHPDALGRPGSEVWSEVWHYFDHAMADIYQNGSTVQGERVMIPIDVEGQMEDRYWTYSWSPLYSEGRIGGVFTVVQDVSSMVSSRRELAHSEDLLRMALNASQSVGLYDWDVQSNLVYAEPNFARVYGVDPADAAAGAPIERFTAAIHPDDVERVRRAIEREVESCRGFSEEYRLLQQDGSVRWVEVQGRCTCSPDGTPLRFSGVAVDNTERKLAESALLQNEKLAAVGRLASSIAHEINNPLESVTNLLYLARTSQELETAHDFLDLAERELARVSAITNQTLRFHKQSAKPRDCTAQELFESAITLYHGKLLNAQITLETDFRSTVAVRCLEGEIRQVIANLLGNAVDAMQNTPKPRLQLRSHDGLWQGEPALVLTIADNGPGIPDAVRDRLFEPFFTTKGANGNGLGLWISHEIIARHHGAIRLHTSQQAQHHGTVFSIFLPQNAAPTAP